jgi:hypothetical protein
MANWDAGLNNGAFLRLGVDQINQSVNDNASADSWILVMARGSNTASWTGSPIAWNVNINGTPYSGTFTFDFRSSDSVVIASSTIVVPHNSDGTKTIAVSASIGPTGTAVGGPASVSGNFTQTTIPRASNITLSNGDFVAAGGNMTVFTNRASTSFTHDVDYTFAAASGRALTNITDSGVWTAPLSLMNQIPNATVGYGTFITKTYSTGGSYVGQSNKVFGVTVPSNIVPTVTGITLSEATTTPNVSGLVGAYVKGISKLNFSMTGVSGVYGSTITARKLEVAGQTISTQSGATPAPINASGTVPVKATVTDSRGRTASYTQNITVLNYAPPVINSIGFQRALSDGTPNNEGTYIRINMNLTASSLMNGTEKNSLTYRISTRQRGTTTWIPKTPVTVTGLNFTNYAVIGTYPITQAFEVMVEVYDIFATSTVQSTVSTSAVFMDWQSVGMGIGKFWEKGTLDIAGNVYVEGRLFGTPAIPTSARAAMFPSPVAGDRYYDLTLMCEMTYFTVATGVVRVAGWYPVTGALPSWNLTRSSAQSMPSGVLTNVAWNGWDQQPAAAWGGGGIFASPSVTIPQAGKYMVSFSASIALSTPVRLISRITVNSTFYESGMQSGAGTSVHKQEEILNLASGDVVTLSFRQDDSTRNLDSARFNFAYLMPA